MLDEQQEAPAAEAEDAEDVAGSQDSAASGDDDAGAQDAGGVSAEVLADMPDAPTEWDDGAPADAGPRQAAEERAQQAADAGAQAAAEDEGAGAPAE
jgi:hypothetical protein